MHHLTQHDPTCCHCDGGNVPDRLTGRSVKCGRRLSRQHEPQAVSTLRAVFIREAGVVQETTALADWLTRFAGDLPEAVRQARRVIAAKRRLELRAERNREELKGFELDGRVVFRVLMRCGSPEDFQHLAVRYGEARLADWQDGTAPLPRGTAEDMLEVVGWEGELPEGAYPGDLDPHLSAKFLDGPRFEQWLHDEGVYPRIDKAVWTDSLYAWRGGRRASIAVADRLLTSVGVLLSDVPADLFLVPSTRGERRRPPFELVPSPPVLPVAEAVAA